MAETDKKGAKMIGEILIESELITREQLDTVLEIQKQENRRVGELVIEMGYVTEEQLIKALEYMFHIPYVDLNALTIERGVLSLISESIAQKYWIIPIAKEQNVLTVAMFDPLDFFAIDDVSMVTGLEVKTCISTKSEIIRAIDRYYGNESAERAVEDLRKEYSLLLL